MDGWTEEWILTWTVAFESCEILRESSVVKSPKANSTSRSPIFASPKKKIETHKERQRGQMRRKRDTETEQQEQWQEKGEGEGVWS